MDTLETPVVLNRDMVTAIMRLRGGVNTDMVAIGETDYEKDTLLFLGFKGKYSPSDGLFHGFYVYRLAQPKDADNDGLRVAGLPRVNVEALCEM